MPDKRTHRGAHPEDDRLFASDVLPRLRRAAGDLCWLLSREYAFRAALKLVGDRYQLAARQRMAVLRSVCSDEALERRLARMALPGEARGGTLLIDGFNVLTTVEAALGGAIVVGCRDGAYRDLAGVHGSYRAVEETRPAILAVGETLASLGADRCVWLLDRPVSNSGRLKTLLLRIAGERGWGWDVELLHNPDRALREASECIATADGAILDRSTRSLTLARAVIDASGASTRVLWVFPRRGPA